MGMVASQTSHKLVHALETSLSTLEMGQEAF